MQIHKLAQVKKAHVFLSGTRVVPGPTRLTTQGGKSRQNMH